MEEMNLLLVPGIAAVFIVLTALIAATSYSYWMVVAWRAMRAHERLAAVAQEWLVQRTKEEPKVAQPVGRQATRVSSATVLPQDQFTPKQDAPAEFPWAKEP